MTAPASPEEERRAVLRFAIENGRADIVSRALDEEKKDPDGNLDALLSAELDDSKSSALHMACRAGNVDIIRVLLLRGGRADLRDSKGSSPYEVAASDSPANKFPAIRSAFEAELFTRCANGATDSALQIISGGLDIHTCEQAGYSPVAWAQLFEQHDTVQRLLDISQSIPSTPASGAGVAPSQETDQSLSTSCDAVTSHLSKDSLDASHQHSTAVESHACSEVAPLQQASVDKGAEQFATPWPTGDVPCDDLSLLWPPVHHARLGKLAEPAANQNQEEDKLNKGSVLTKLTSDVTLVVVLASGATVLENSGLVQSLEHGLHLLVQQLRADQRVERSNQEDLEWGVPLVTPVFQGLGTFSDVDMYQPVDESEEQGPATALSSGTCETLMIRFSLDTELVAVPGGFQLTILPQDATQNGGAGQAVIRGHSCSALKMGLEALKQLLHHAPLIQSAHQLVLPWMVVEDVLPGGFPGLLVDVWKLPWVEISSLIEAMKKWRIWCVYVPLPEMCNQGLASFRRRHADILRDILKVRTACEVAGIEVIPIITAGPNQAPLARLQQTLAQFQGVQQIAVRIKKEALGDNNGNACVRLEDLHKLAVSAGIRSVVGGTISLWMPMHDADLVQQVQAWLCKRSGILCGSQDRHRFNVVLETSGYEGELQRARASICMLAAYGIPSHVFITSSCTHSIPATEQPCVPPFVWPGRHISDRAEAISAISTQTVNMGAKGLIMEIPVYGAPWCRAEVGLLSSWCRLSVFIAAGLLHNPAAAQRALGDMAVLSQDSMQDHQANGSCTLPKAHLGSLLAVHLLNVRGRHWTSSNELRMFSGADHALAIWDTMPVDGPPLKLLPQLHATLGGRILIAQKTSQQKVVADLNLWWKHLTHRRQLLREICATNGVDFDRSILDQALLGVEWLRYASRFLLLLVKHAHVTLESEADWMQVRKYIAKLPPTKVSDVRNGFLLLLRQMSPSEGEGMDSQDADEQIWAPELQVAETLWTAGLKLGAALDLEPWVGLASRD